MFNRHFLNTVFLLILTGCSSFTSNKAFEEKLDVNSSQHKDAPYILLVSIDGLRHDYLEMYQPPNLLKLAQKGVHAKSLKPVFPTLTFPNHYSIVTGLRPDNHGIVANHFIAPDLNNDTYSLRDREAVTNSDFYKGIPLWSLARQQGQVSATFFWPGSEAPIAEKYPSYWRTYEHNAPHSERIDTVIKWLELPKENRPHFSTLYFSKVDSAGHAFGPDSSQVKKALHKVDKDIGILINRLEQLDFPVNLVITSDHGMTDLSFSRIAYLDEHFKKSKDEKIWDRFEIVHTSALAFFYYKGPKEEKQADLKRALELLNKHPHYSTYKRGNLPKHLHFNENRRMGDLVSIADTGWTIGPKSELKVIPGSHGFDPEETLDMDGVFIAQGPLFKKKMRIERFENIHIYPFLAELLGLNLEGISIDGSPAILKQIMRKK